MELIPHSLTAALRRTGIRSLSDLGRLLGPRDQTVLYLRHGARDAAPKCISGRTSYHGVRLAFHPYPQVIPPVFNLGGFGPPRGLTRASACPWVAHTVSGLGPATVSPYSDSLSLRLPVDRLTLLLIANSPAHSSKGTLSPAEAGSNGL